MRAQQHQNCRDCGADPYADHRAWCPQAPDAPDPSQWSVPENDPADLAAVDDQVVAQITGEPREFQ